MPNISFKTKIIDFNCRFSQNFTNNTRKHDLAFPCYYRIYVSLQGRFLRPNSEDKTPTCSLLSIARLQSYSSRSKIRNFGFLEFLPQTDHRHRLFLCRENHFGSSMFTYLRILAIFALTWTKSGNIAPILLLGGLRVRITADEKGRYTLLLEFPSFIILKQKLVIFYGRIVLLHNHSTSLCSTIWYHCSNSLLSGLKVRITANRKGWYTWLLEFPTLINLKNKMAVFMTGLFRFATVFTYRLAQLSNVDNFQKRKRQQHWILKFSFPKRYNQPMHRV